ncbi:DUF6630 family protein [Agreia bicolorata]|uniref:DUF6630 domain-containing protein n=1 Tax=Agreia bicolorata TaxID=110935 RepID=A0ABR5CB96_9MICO|nr:hypothetical protein [Agreia bicolorata]KJC62909.1 hypothetical protein TZ00_18030 [Agreia bicolorata]
MAWNPFRRDRAVDNAVVQPPTAWPHASDDDGAARWRELVGLLSPDAGLAEVVLQAYSSPTAYLEAHAAEAENRGLEDDDVDPWFALVDWLIENELAHELDWKDNAAELAWALSRMSVVLSSGVDLQSVDHADAHLTFGMLRANALLAPVGLELLVFDIDSDSYPVVLVESAKRDRIVALAAELGHRVEMMTPERARHEGGRDYTGEIEL